GARAVGERLALRVHVAGRVLGARVGLGLGLRDGGLDLGVKIRAYLRELVLAGADLEEVAARMVDGILRHPLAHFLFGAVARVVVVGRVWLEAIALQLDERRTTTRARDRDGLLRLRVRVEHVHAVGDEARHRIGRRLVGDVLRRHLPLEPRRNREEVVLDDEHHRQLVHGREVRRLVEVARARRRVAAEGEDDVRLLAVTDRQGEADGVRELRPHAHRARDDAVLRLRELVQHLAPRGVLVRRLREDHPELFERRHTVPSFRSVVVWAGLVFAITFVCASPVLIAGIDLTKVTFASDIPIAVGIGILLTGYAPTLAALIVARLFSREGGVGALMRPVLRWR